MTPLRTWLCILGLALAFTACKKEDKSDPINEEVSQNSSDVSDIKSETDLTNSDITDVFNASPQLAGGRIDAEVKPICGCIIDSSRIASKILTFKFDSATPCSPGSRLRSGAIQVQLVGRNYWREAGAKLIITLKNYKVTRLSDDKSWTFNGVKTLTNKQGTNWLGFFFGNDSIVQVERADKIKIKFDNGTEREQSIARSTTVRLREKEGAKRFFFRTIGDTTVDGKTNVDTWGVNRFGNTYINAYTRPWVSDNYCDIWRPTSGQVVHTSNGNTVTITLGVTKQGEPSTLNCAYGYKLNWVLSNGATGQAVLSY